MLLGAAALPGRSRTLARQNAGLPKILDQLARGALLSRFRRASRPTIAPPTRNAGSVERRNTSMRSTTSPPAAYCTSMGPVPSSGACRQVDGVNLAHRGAQYAFHLSAMAFAQASGLGRWFRRAAPATPASRHKRPLHSGFLTSRVLTWDSCSPLPPLRYTSPSARRLATAAELPFVQNRKRNPPESACVSVWNP